MKNIYLIVGQSGSGKTTIVNCLENKYGLKSVQSYTTRPKRSDDETGHIFISDEEYDKLTNIVANTEFCGYRYCVQAEQIDNNDLYVIDSVGVKTLKVLYKGIKKIKTIYISSDLTTRYERMRLRAQRSGKKYLEAVEESLNRIVNDVKAFYNYEHHKTPIDLMVFNNGGSNLDSITEKIYSYIQDCEKE